MCMEEAVNSIAKLLALEAKTGQRKNSHFGISKLWQYVAIRRISVCFSNHFPCPSAYVVVLAVDKKSRIQVL